MLRPIVVAVGLALAVTPVAAQVEQAPRERAARLLLSAGIDVLGRDFGEVTPGIVAHVGYEHRIGGARSRFSLRLAGDYWRTDRVYTADLNDGQGPFDVRRTNTIVGGSLLVHRRLPNYRTFRLYALGGLGVQHYSRRDETDWVMTGPNTGSKIVYVPPVRVNTISYTGGLGASGRLRRVTPFAEVRLTVLPALADAGLQAVRAPLTIGVRF